MDFSFLSLVPVSLNNEYIFQNVSVNDGMAQTFLPGVRSKFSISRGDTGQIQLFRERLSGKVHATVLKGIVGGFEFSFFQRNLKELVRKAMEMCLRVLKESNKSRFDSYSRQEQCIDHIPYYLSGLSRALFPTTFLEIAVYRYNAMDFVLTITQ